MHFTLDTDQHIGRRREQQDAVRIRADLPGFPEGALLAVVCDGMGGLQGGAEASRLAADAFTASFARIAHAEPVGEVMRRALAEAGRAVFQAARARGVEGDMGTTLVAAVFEGSRLHWLSVGDSRLYLVRGGQFHQLNTEHNLGTRLAEAVRSGRLSAEEAASHPQRHALTSFLGTARLDEIDGALDPIELHAGDQVLLCSDGLHGVLSEAEMAAVLAGAPRGREASALVAATVALERTNQDNISACLVTATASTEPSETRALPLAEPPLPPRPQDAGWKPLALLALLLLVGAMGVYYVLREGPTSPVAPVDARLSVPAESLRADSLAGDSLASSPLPADTSRLRPGALRSRHAPVAAACRFIAPCAAPNPPPRHQQMSILSPAPCAQARPCSGVLGGKVAHVEPIGACTRAVSDASTTPGSWRRLGLVTLLVLMPLLSAWAQPPVERMERSTVRVFCVTPFGLEGGSGFVVSPGVVATNFHVIRCAGEGGSTEVGLSPEQLLPASVLWSSPERDLALLRVGEALGRPSVRLVPAAQVKSGDDVRAMGFPSAADVERTDRLTASMFVPTLTRGIISRAVTFDDLPYYQTDAAISAGNSGGPLFDVCGDVLGINTMVASNEDGVQAAGIGYALRADEVITALRRIGVTPEVTTTRCGSADAAQAAPDNPGTPIVVPDSALAPVQQGGFDALAWFYAQPRAVRIAVVVLPFLLLLLLIWGLRRGRSDGRSLAERPRRDATPTSAVVPVVPQRRGVLVALSGPLAGQRFALQAHPLLIGRDGRMCQVAFPEDAKDVSRRHASVVWDPARGAALVQDAGSSLGTFLANGQRLPPNVPRALRRGERFYLSRPAYAFAIE